MKIAAFVVLVPMCLAGTRPRPNAADYRSQDTAGDVTIAAEMLGPGQVRNIFAADLHKYIVVEVAVYPKDGSGAVEVNRMDFRLKPGSDAPVRAANPSTIVHVPQRDNNPTRRPSNLDINTTAEIGYEHGTDPYGRKRNGVYTGTGVEVGQQPYPPPPGAGPSGPDARTKQMELEDSALNEGATTKPVAGFLYFPISAKKTVTYDLEYYTPQGRVHLTLK